jgi:peptidoglycan/LPS O-acetylase OafA/YrhL
MLLARSDLSYKPHIAGLRAIAVLSVILYHFGFDMFPGGFVGVDLFFVISGFLITRIIVNEVINTGSFDFKNFYLRRARRIIPALYFTILISFVFSVLILSPQHFQRFGSSLLYAVFGISNIFFWKESSYFDTESVYKPLLHNWSLGVEEQFYLFWPIIIVYLLYKIPKYTLILIFIIGTISFFLNYMYLSSKESSTIFYLVQFRTFEFVIGAIMVWFVQFQPKNNTILEMLMLLGIVGVLFSVTTFSKSIIFPYYNALIPCVSAALIIYSGSAKYSSKVLNNRLLISIGVISYSLYLVHWPTLVFYDYYESGGLDLFEKSLLVSISFIIAILMYRFVEKPFIIPKGCFLRSKIYVQSKIYSVILVVVILLSYNASVTNGWDFRLSEDNLVLLEKNTSESHKMNTPLLNSYVWGLGHKYLQSNASGKKILIVGDSHAGNVANAFSEVGFSKGNYVDWLIIFASCDIIISNKQLKIPEHATKLCKENHNKLSELKGLNFYDLIVLASSWQGQGVLYIEDTIAALKEKGAKKIIVIASKYLTASGLDVLGRVTLFGINKDISVFPSQYSVKVNDTFRNLQLGDNILYPLEYFCVKDKECRVLDNNGYIINYDTGHLTPKGALFFGEKLVPALGY